MLNFYATVIIINAMVAPKTKLKPYCVAELHKVEWQTHFLRPLSVLKHPYFSSFGAHDRVTIFTSLFAKKYNN